MYVHMILHPYNDLSLSSLCKNRPSFSHRQLYHREAIVSRVPAYQKKLI